MNYCSNPSKRPTKRAVVTRKEVRKTGQISEKAYKRKNQKDLVTVLKKNKGVRITLRFKAGISEDIRTGVS